MEGIGWYTAHVAEAKRPIAGPVRAGATVLHLCNTTEENRRSLSLNRLDTYYTQRKQYETTVLCPMLSAIAL